MGYTHTTRLLLFSSDAYITTKISFSAVWKLTATFYGTTQATCAHIFPSAIDLRHTT